MKGLACVFLIFILSSTKLFATKLNICNNCQVSSIKEGVCLASPFDTLLVEKGTYREYNIIIDKPLVISGIDYPVIDGEYKGEIIRIISDKVTIEGFKLVNVSSSYTEDFAAIRVANSQDFTIKNLILETIFFGIYLEKSRNGHLYNNTISGEAVREHDSGNGIHLWHSNNIRIENNSVTNTRDGIYLEFSDKCEIINNLSKDNLRYGLHFMFSNDDIYRGNIFERNGAGVAVMFSKKIKMSGNVFKDNWGPASYGLLLKEINDAEIKNNTFEKNTVGINLEGANRIKYSNNNFVRNGWAIKIRGACYANIFIGNNFLNNSFDISYNSNINDNIFNNNYWSSYNGYDLNKDGIGDVPYRPIKLFSYIVNRTPETIILLRSPFMDIIDFSERVTPVFTPDNLLDNNPLIKKRI